MGRSLSLADAPIFSKDNYNYKMNTSKQLEYPVHELIDQRWSPRAFQPRELETHQVRSLFEAARWAPSSYNAQPWRYIYALNQSSDAFKPLLECLFPANQLWAKHAGMLILALAKMGFDGKEGINRHAYYDLGAANYALTTQATSMGLHVHQMGGFDQQKARELFNINEDFDPVAMLAVGYKGYPEQLPEKFRALEQPKKDRMRQEEFVTRFMQQPQD